MKSKKKDCNPTICRKTDPSGRNDLLRGHHYSILVPLNHHQEEDPDLLVEVWFLDETHF